MLYMQLLEEGHRTMKDNFISILNTDERKRQQSAFVINKRVGKSRTHTIESICC
jgi:hypothetical protein